MIKDSFVTPISYSVCWEAHLQFGTEHQQVMTLIHICIEGLNTEMDTFIVIITIYNTDLHVVGLVLIRFSQI